MTMRALWGKPLTRDLHRQLSTTLSIRIEQLAALAAIDKAVSVRARHILPPGYIAAARKSIQARKDAQGNAGILVAGKARKKALGEPSNRLINDEAKRPESAKASLRIDSWGPQH